jgi:hypothetical protein
VIAKLRRLRRGSPGERASPEMERLLSGAREAIREQRWRDAMTWLERARALVGDADPRVLAGLARVHRGRRDVEGAWEVLEPARARHPDDLELLLEATRISAYAYRRSSEDEEHAWKDRLQAAASGLWEHRRRGASSGQLAMVLGDASLALRHWDAARELWRDVEVSHPHRVLDACLRQAQAARSAGDLRAAREALQRIPGEQLGDDRVLAEVDRLERSLRRWTSTEIAHNALLRARTGDSSGAGRALRCAVDLRDLRSRPVELGSLVDDLVGVLAPVEERGSPQSGMPDTGVADLKTCRVVHVVGLLYSGSGAVVDYLGGHPQVHRPFGDREPGFLKKSGNLAELLDASIRMSDEFPIELVRVVLASILGLGQSGRPLLELVGDGARSTVVDATRGLAARMMEAWARAEQGAPRADVEAGLRQYVGTVLGLEAPSDADALLLNNALLADELDRLDLFADAQAAVVIRHPADQFVSQQLEAPYPLAPESFVEVVEARYDGLERASSGQSRDRIRVVAFEDFVSQPATRRALLAWLGLAPEQLTDSAFDPRRSQRNIGIHRGHPRSEIQHVLDRLAERYEQLRRDS